MHKGVILCIDDEPMVLLSLRDQLSRIVENNYGIEIAESGEEALSLFAELKQEDIEIPLIICDQTMKGVNGADLLAQLHQEYPKTLKILLTGSASIDGVVQAVNKANLYRYITKPWNEGDFSLTVREALRRYEQDKQLAEHYQALQETNAALQREVIERHRVEERLAYDALHDSLTGLPNRNLLMEQLERNLRMTVQNPAYQFAVLFIDLDRFKIVNDSLGHVVGDQFLQAIARRLRKGLRSSDFIARIGGDEFTVILEDVQRPEEAAQAAERILEALCIPIALEPHTLCASASIGVVIGFDGYQNATDLLRDADLAMYKAKETGKACYALFNEELRIRALKSFQIEHDLHQALERQEFVLHYQPIISLKDQCIVGFESLVRWNHPQKGLIPPCEFIPVAEETGLIIALGQWILNESCRQLRVWHQDFPMHSNLSISVNLAAKQLGEPSLIHQIDLALEQSGLDGQFLKLELTESMLLQNVGETLKTMATIRSRGINLSIDDFGTGYSSLSYLPKFPINTLKIDRSFVSNMGRDSENLEVIRCIIVLAYSIGMDIIAEGIETREQASQLIKLGCKLGQGYLFSRPLKAADATQFIAQANCCTAV